MALRGALNHRKTRKLARLLGIFPCFALGIMEGLWHVTATQADTGAIGRLPNEEIADQIGYLGDADALVDAMVDAGFLEEHRLHRLIVHNWHLRSDNTLDAKLFREGKYYACGAMPRGTKLDRATKEQLTERFYRRPPASLFPAEPVVGASAPQAGIASIPADNVIPFRVSRPVPSEPLPPAATAAEEAFFAGNTVTAPYGAAKRLPEPEPVPVPEPTTPYPPPRRGTRREMAAEIERQRRAGTAQHLDRAAQRVVQACRFTGTASVRMQAVVWFAVEAECRTRGQPAESAADAVAALMVENWKTYAGDARLMRFRWGDRRFFEEGHWAKPQTWPYDEQRLAELQRARVGMA